MLSLSLQDYTDPFCVTHLLGFEGISEIFQFRVQFYGDAVLNSDVIGKAAKLTITTTQKSQRIIHGFVRLIKQKNKANRFIVYQAILTADVWWLSLDRDYRIFQQKSVIDIIRKIFGEFGIDHVEWRLQKTYTARSYVVQYQEKTWNFVQRLLQEAGLVYYFDHQENNCSLIITDGSSQFSLFKYLQSDTLDSNNQEIIGFDPKVQTGYFFSDKNKVVKQLFHIASNLNQQEYRNKICLVNSQNLFTAKAFKKPVIHGPHTAKIVASHGTNVQVKVRFHWDIRHDYSCWISVAQANANNNSGMQWVPDIGQEVLIDFEQGDAETPIVLGALYNNINPPIFQLPKNRWHSGVVTPNHTIRFNDKPGNENFLIDCKNNFVEIVNNDWGFFTKNNYELTTADYITDIKNGEFTLTADNNIILTTQSSTIKITSESIIIQSTKTKLN